MIQRSVTNLPYGVVLIRHYDDQKGSVDSQCGPVHWYESFVRELIDYSIRYYNQPDGTNKFARKVTLNAYGTYTPYPTDTTQFFGGNTLTEAMCCYPTGNGTSRIDARWLGTENVVYRMPACLSHEFGHAYHNWCQFFDGGPMAEILAYWKRTVGEPATELFANAFRVLKGTSQTRGVSGPGSREPLPEGIADPKDHPEWMKQMDLLPELCAYAQAHGCKSLSWQGGVDGYWQLQRNDGTWMKQEGPYKWFRWNCTWSWVTWSWSCAWVADFPDYNRT